MSEARRHRHAHCRPMYLTKSPRGEVVSDLQSWVAYTEEGLGETASCRETESGGGGVVGTLLAYRLSENIKHSRLRFRQSWRLLLIKGDRGGEGA